jgi:hypothetical protein
MSDCTNGELRDLLPELMHGTLDAETQRAVEAHVASCGECAEELALLRALRPALVRGPAVDSQRIAAAVNARTTRAPQRSRLRTPLRIAIAAAALLAVGGIGYGIAIREWITAPERTAVGAHPPMMVANVGIVDNLHDLTDDDVRALTASLDGLSGVPDADPSPVIDPLGASTDDISAGGK